MSQHKPYRRKACENCAFKADSLEMLDPDFREEFEMKICMKTFYCHETMYNRNADNDKRTGNFDPTRKPDGSPAQHSDHLVCAGFVKTFADEYGIDPDDIDCENFFKETTS